MKLNSSLKPGNYKNRLIVSVVSNPYTPKAVMTRGADFNYKLRSLENDDNLIKHFKRSPTAPSIMTDALNVENDDSDYEIKLWYDKNDETAYYYSNSGTVYLNTDSSEMFLKFWATDELKNILDIDISDFDTSSVKNMSQMFSGLSKLRALDVSNFDTSKVVNMSGMFYGTSSLITLDISGFDVSKVTDIGAMFSNMSSLASLDLSNFNTFSATNMERTFLV